MAYANVTQAADFFNCSAWMVRKMIREKKIPSIRIGRCYRIDLEAAAEKLAEPREEKMPRQNFAEALKNI